MHEPLIIEAAINGGTPKSRNRHVPRTVDEVVECAKACVEAGATIVHNHTDDPIFGGPARHQSADYARAWREILALSPHVLLYPTVFGEGTDTIEERYAHVVELHEAGVLGMAPLDPGTMNAVGLVGGASEELGRANTVYQFTLEDAEYIADFCRRQNLVASVSIFEPGWLRLALRMYAESKLPRGAMVKFYFGGENLLFGLPPSEQSLDAYVAMLEGTSLPWSVALQGGDVTEIGLAEAAIKRGGHVRVGLEDYRGPREPTNVELVAEVVELSRKAHRPIASADDLARIFNRSLRY